jgi:hypothetical protein
MRVAQSEKLFPIESKRKDGKGHRDEGFASETARAAGVTKQSVNQHISGFPLGFLNLSGADLFCCLCRGMCCGIAAACVRFECGQR